MILSIIIPTYNEEEYLPVLLESIKQQDFRDYEIIVADANSKDNTVKIAEEYGCIVVEGGMPAVGRNNGAKVAKGEYLLFLDSDLKLTEDYLAKVIYEFKMERLGIAITQMKPLSKKTEDKILHDLANLFMISVEKIKPHGAGCYGIIAKRELHECCGGFDEELTFGEDTEYIERLAKKERFKVLRNAKIGVSTRRLEEEGLATLAKQYGKSTVNDFLGIRTEASDLNYGFDHGKEHISKHKLDKIALESEKLDRLKNSYDESKQKINTAKVYLKKAKKTKTGQYSTTEEILEKLRSKHPIVGKILEQRGVKKLLSTYVNALPELINPKTGKIHTSFNQTVTATGRLSSSNPNLQNIPIRDSEGREIRRAFIPDDRCLFFSADYSQIELRIMADLSEDPNMIEAFTSGKDIHAATAAKIYKIPIEEVTPDMRRKAKTANFGIIYGISVFGLSDRLNIPRSEAKELINGYFETYPHIKEYMDKSIQIAREKGYVETISGRKRMLPDINSKNSIVRGYAERNAINAPIQGSAADIIKIAMVRIFDRFEKNGLKARMILQVHDELNFSVPENEIEIVEHIVKEEMENAYQLKVPLIADSGIGKNWLEAH